MMRKEREGRNGKVIQQSRTHWHEHKQAAHPSTAGSMATSANHCPHLVDDRACSLHQYHASPIPAPSPKSTTCTNSGNEAKNGRTLPLLPPRTATRRIRSISSSISVTCDEKETKRRKAEK
ncbi:hypothetical protein BDQ17DRAFT_1097537 [Cyathus striatus]|nr:hypothetical protein BDQ17DRAFT_1097537 [Cyathus striatus]